MKRAFLSYSLLDSQQYVVSVLARNLQESGYVLASSYAGYSQGVYQGAQTEIDRSNLFIGVISEAGDEHGAVLDEYRYAIARGIPSVLLIDWRMGTRMRMGSDMNVVLFDRDNPQAAMDTLNERLRIRQTVSPTSTDNTGAWVLGAAAVLTLIGLLSEGTSRRPKRSKRRRQ